MAAYVSAVRLMAVALVAAVTLLAACSGDAPTTTTQVYGDYPHYDTVASATQAADLIVTGTVLGAETRDINITLGADREKNPVVLSYSVSRIEVTLVIKGDVKQGSVLEIKQAPYPNGQQESRLKEKDAVGIFFLESYPSGIPCSLLNPEQGMVAIRDGKAEPNFANTLFQQARTGSEVLSEISAALTARTDSGQTTTTSARPAAATITEYAAAMSAWNEAFHLWMWPENDVQIDRAYIAKGDSLLDQLDAMQPPAPIAAAHQRVVDASDAVLSVEDKRLAAEEAQDQAAFDAAVAETGCAWTALTIATTKLQTVQRLATSTGASDARYVSDVLTWLWGLTSMWATYWDSFDTPTDVTGLTAGYIRTAENAVADIHDMCDQLRAIEAPAIGVEAHRKVVAGCDVMLATLDRRLAAMRNKDQAEFDATDADEATALNGAIDEWMEEWETLVEEWWTRPAGSTESSLGAVGGARDGS